jgi:hypothetical protein
MGLFPRPGFAFSCFFYFYNDYFIALNPERLLFAGLSRWLSKNPLNALSFIYSESTFDFFSLSFDLVYYSSSSSYLLLFDGLSFYLSLFVDSYFFLSSFEFYLLLIVEVFPFCDVNFSLSFDGSFLSFVVDLFPFEIVDTYFFKGGFSSVLTPSPSYSEKVLSYLINKVSIYILRLSF